MLCLVPTAAARDGWRSALASKADPESVRVWCWSDLWEGIRGGADRGPRVLSEVGRRGLIREAVNACRRDGAFAAAERLVETPGFRRLLGRQFEAWSASRLEAEPGMTPDGVEPEEWSAYVHYLRLLEATDSVDHVGLAWWASERARVKRFFENDADCGALAVADASRIGKAAWRAMTVLQSLSLPMLVSLPGDSERAESGRAEAYVGVSALSERIREWGFLEGTPPEPSFPAGMTAARRDLFRLQRTRSEHCEGLSVVGMPAGTGETLAAARAVAEALARGANPEEIALLVPEWTEPARELGSTLRSWGIACSGGPRSALARDPAVACLVSAARLPVDQWDARRLAGVLGHGRLSPTWDAPKSRAERADAARAVRECGAFRDLGRLQAAMERTLGREPRAGTEGKAAHLERERARVALPVLEAFGRLFSGAHEPAPWEDQIARLEQLLGALGLERTGDSRALGLLRLALDEQAGLLADMGSDVKERRWAWSEFVKELEDLGREVTWQPSPWREGTVRLATVTELCGVEIPWRIVMGLGEGTFPSRHVVRSTWAYRPEVDLRRDDQTITEESQHADWLVPATLASEMRRFLDLPCSTTSGLILIHGCTDAKGQPLLRAGFVDELSELFSESDWESVSYQSRRLEPVLAEDLGRAVRERRVRAVARALVGDQDELTSLASQPSHAQALRGAALGLRVQHFRSRERFSHFDGMLTGDRTIRSIAEEFDRRSPGLSPSQLETYALCPFRYYQRYVLNVLPGADADELAEDWSGRGRILHQTLEELHSLLRLDGPDAVTLDSDELFTRLSTLITQQMDSIKEQGTDLEIALHELEREILTDTGRRYVAQHEKYFEGSPRPIPAEFELAFGGRGTLPALRIGPDARGRSIGLQGVVDRLDVIEHNEQTYFRVIDYKSGSVPGRAELKDGRALQLPLYALAVLRLQFDEGSAQPDQVGYWGLKEGVGYKKLFPLERSSGPPRSDPELWAEFFRRLEAFVLALADRIRSGEFPVSPVDKECERSCDYRRVCRVRQLGAWNKEWADRPKWDPTGEQS